MKLNAIFSRGLAFGTLAVIDLSSCQKEGMQPAVTITGPAKSALTVGLPPVISWWSSVAAIPYTSFPNDTPVFEIYSAGFTINNKGYVLGGMLNLQRGDALHVPDLWMFDPSTQGWSKQTPYPGNPGVGEEVFVIDDNAYVMTENNALWQYNQLANQWIPKATFPGEARFYGTAMAINGKGYVGLGVDDNTIDNLKDWWQYDPAADHWTQMHDFGGDPRQQAVGFSIDGKGYVCWGLNNQGGILRPVWQYDPLTDSWTKRQNCPTAEAFSAVTATIGGIDVGLMTDGTDLWLYNPAIDAWSDQGAVRYGDHGRAAGFVIGDSYFLANILVSTYNWSR